MLLKTMFISLFYDSVNFQQHVFLLMTGMLNVITTVSISNESPTCFKVKNK